MKNVIRFLLVICVMCYQSAHSFDGDPVSHTLRITPTGTQSAPCPLNLITYTVGTTSGSLPTCTWSWTITGGTITSKSGASATVKWFDEPGTGTLTVTAGTCSTEYKEERGNSATATYSRRSLFAKSFPSGTCSSSSNVPYCSTSPFTICVNKMYIQNTGSINEPPLTEASAYNWTIPAGFRQSGTTTNGPVTVTTTTNTLTLEPLGSGGGTVSVVASVKNPCGQSVSDSNPTTITIVRTPQLGIAANTSNGAYTARCGAVAPVIFTVTALPCATSYNWTGIPSGWTGTSSTGSIELTPNGENGGTLSVTIGLSTGSSVVVTRTIGYTSDPPPALSISNNNGYREFCAGESFTYIANVPTGYTSTFGFDWYADTGVLINGSSSSASSPVHTTTNSVTVTVAGQAYGTKFIHARVNNLKCPAGYYGWSQTRVGVYSNEEFNINGPSAVCPNTVADYTSSYIDGDITGYQWSAPSGWSSSGQGTPYFHVSVPATYSGEQAAITLRLGNRCGYTNTPDVLPLSLGYCGFSVSPNPASSTLTITDLNLNDGETAEARMVDKSNNQVKRVISQNGKIEIDVSKLPNGQYILLVHYKGKVESEMIIVDH